MSDNKMGNPLVTIVLPIYNVEKYLEDSIRSVVGQTYQNLEILLIDDGSPDNCPLICDEWAEKDSRIRVIHKKNQGLGMARNTGIENATGDYICFFDSDDYIRADTVEKTVQQIKDEQADMAVFGFSSVNSTGKHVSTFIPCVGRKTYRGVAVRDAFLPDFIAPDYRGKSARTLYMSAWIAMYSMETIRRSGWSFVSERDIIAEDVYSLVDFMQYVRSVTVLPEAFYYYRMNERSLSRSYRPDRYAKIKHFYLETIKLCRSIGYSEDVLHRVADPYLAFAIAALKQETVSDFTLMQKINGIKSIIDDDVLQEVLIQNKKDVVSWPRWLMFFLIRHKQYVLAFILLRAKS